eukprot:scaffold4823_cov71-Skeletonema_marinoi.AAC.3
MSKSTVNYANSKVFHIILVSVNLLFCSRCLAARSHGQDRSAPVDVWEGRWPAQSFLLCGVLAPKKEGNFDGQAQDEAWISSSAVALVG